MCDFTNCNFRSFAFVIPNLKISKTFFVTGFSSHTKFIFFRLATARYRSKINFVLIIMCKNTLRNEHSYIFDDFFEILTIK